MWLSGPEWLGRNIRMTDLLQVTNPDTNRVQCTLTLLTRHPPLQVLWLHCVISLYCTTTNNWKQLRLHNLLVFAVATVQLFHKVSYGLVVFLKIAQRLSNGHVDWDHIGIIQTNFGGVFLLQTCKMGRVYQPQPDPDGKTWFTKHDQNMESEEE